MGSIDGGLDERPMKTVTMTGFELGQTEVSIGQYREFLAKSGIRLNALISGFRENQKGDNYPVVGLTYDEKRAYCQAQGGDLPTAAQLQYASRFDELDSDNGQVVVSDNNFESTEPVSGGYQNRFGVYNLLGNVWESSLDAYDRNFYTRMGSKNPYNPLTNRNTQWEELKGSSFLSYRSFARPASRNFSKPNLRFFGDGFRCARPLPRDSQRQPLISMAPPVS